MIALRRTSPQLPQSQHEARSVRFGFFACGCSVRVFMCQSILYCVRRARQSSEPLSNHNKWMGDIRDNDIALYFGQARYRPDHLVGDRQEVPN